MRQAESRFPGARGLSLHCRLWTPEADGDFHGRVVIAHGLGEHGGRYRHVGERLTIAGYEVVVPDHRGHGRSEGRRVAVVAFDDYLEDLHELIQLSARERGEAPTHLIGHSMGGLIASAYALRHPDELRTLVLSAPAVMPPDNLSAATLAVGRVVSRFAPNVGTVSLPLDKVSRDPAVVAAYFGDPLVFPRRIRARLGAEMLRAIAEVGAGLATLRLPLLVMQGTADRLVDPRAARFVFDRAGSADKTLKVYDGLYHEIFNEPERDAVLDDLVGWLEARRVASPAVGSAEAGREA